MELVEEEIKEELEGTFLENAPVVKISAATGQGIPELIDTIERLTSDDAAEKDTQTIPRLPIDRAFSISGFGTIITGTLLSGTIAKDTSLMMYPIGKECKIRSIQVHGQDVDQCYAGQRVAINLSNVKKSELKRGCVLAPPNSMKNTMMLDVKMNVLPSSMRILTNHSRLHLFTGTSEILCRAILLDKEEIGPGESGYVQLRLEEEIAVRRGDKFVVRFYSPMETIGGGVILEPNPVKKKRFQEETIEELKQKESGSSADVIALHVKQHGDTMVTLQELAKLTALSMDEVTEDVKELEREGIVHIFAMKKDIYVWHRADEEAGTKKILETLEKYHRTYPYRPGMKKAEIHMTFFKKIKQNVFDLYIEMLAEKGTVSRHQEFLRLTDFEIRKDATYQKVEKIIRDTFEKAAYDFAKFSEIDFQGVDRQTADDIIMGMVDNQEAVKLAEDMYTLASLVDTAKEKIIERLKENNGLITIAEVRDMFATSRKSAKPLLEYMDSIKVTKKTGAESERVAY